AVVGEGRGRAHPAEATGEELWTLPGGSPAPSRAAESAWMEEQSTAASEPFAAAAAHPAADYVQQPPPDWSEQLGSNGSGAVESSAEEELRFADDEGPTQTQYEASTWQREPAPPPSPVPAIAPAQWVAAKPPAAE